MIWKTSYFCGIKTHSFVIPDADSPYSQKIVGSRFFPPHHALCPFKHCWYGSSLCILQLSAIRWFGKRYTFGIRISQKLENPRTQMQSSLVPAHKTPFPYQCRWTLVPSKQGKDKRCPLPSPLPWSLMEARAPGKLHVLQTPGISLASREYSIGMLPCSWCD